MKNENLISSTGNFRWRDHHIHVYHKVVIKTHRHTNENEKSHTHKSQWEKISGLANNIDSTWCYHEPCLISIFIICMNGSWEFKANHERGFSQETNNRRGKIVKNEPKPKIDNRTSKDPKHKHRKKKHNTHENKKPELLIHQEQNNWAMHHQTKTQNFKNEKDHIFTKKKRRENLDSITSTLWLTRSFLFLDPFLRLLLTWEFSPSTSIGEWFRDMVMVTMENAAYTHHPFCLRSLEKTIQKPKRVKRNGNNATTLD